MRLGSKSGQVVAGLFWIGHGEEFLFLLCFRAEVGKAEAALRHELRWGRGWGLGRRWASEGRESQNRSKENERNWGAKIHGADPQAT